MIDMERLEAALRLPMPRFWCTTEEERVALLTALDSLGYLWNSGHRLLDLDGEDYMVGDGIRYDCRPSEQRVTKAYDSIGAVFVEELIQNRSVPEEAFISLLEAGP